MKKKIPRILGVALTVALLVGLFAIAAPVAAGTQKWSTIDIPSTTGLVLDPGNLWTGPFAINSDGSAIYAGAQGGYGSLITSGNGTASWSTAYAQVGKYSAMLSGGAQTGSDYAAVVIQMNGALTLPQVTSFVYNYYFAAAGNWGPHICFYTHDPSDGQTADITLYSGGSGPPPGTPAALGWNTVNVTGSTPGFFWYGSETTFGGAPSGIGNMTTLGTIQAAGHFANHVVDRIQIEYGWWGAGDASQPAYVDDFTLNGVNHDLGPTRLVKSLDGGRTWTVLTNFPAISGPAITDIVCSSIDPNTVYVTDGVDIWRSDDGGVTWAPRTNLFTFAVAAGWTTPPTGMITSIDIGYLAQGPHIFAGVGLTGSGGVYVCYEWQLGMPWDDMQVDINRPASWGAGNASVLDVKVDPANFVTTQMIMAVAENTATGQTYLTHHYDGAQWNSMEAADAELRYSNTTSITNAFRAQIWLPDGFNASLVSGLMQYFVGIASTTLAEGDVYLVVGAAVPTVSPAFDLNIGGPGTATHVTGLDGEGGVATASMLASGYSSTALTTPLVLSSQTGGAVWLPNTKRPTGGASPFFPGTALSSVLVLDSSTALVGTHGADCGVHITNDFAALSLLGATWNGLSLMNINITSIDDLEPGSLFMTTTSTTTPTGGTPAVPADAYTITASAGLPDAFTITAPTGGGITGILAVTAGGVTVVITTDPNGNASYNPATGVLNLPDAGDVATITATAANTYGTFTWTAGAVLTIGEFAAAGGDPITGDSDVVLGGTSPAFAWALPDVTTQDNANLAIGFGSVTVVMSGAGVYNPVTGNISFSAAGETATITATTSLTIVTWTILSGGPTALLTVDADGDCAVAVGAAVAPATPFTLHDKAVAVVPGTTSIVSSVWRYASNWERVFSSSIYGPATTNFIVESSLAGDALFVADVGGTTIWRSLDNGQVWVAQVSALLGGDTIATLVAIDASTLVVGGGLANTVYTTTTNGVIWFARALTIAPTTPYGSPNSLAVSGSKIVVGCSGGNVALSEDSGVTWSGKGRPTGVTTAAFVALGGDDTIYATYVGGGVYKRGTTTWSQLDKTGDTVAAGSGIVTAPGITGVDMVYAADADGVCRIKTNRTVGELLADAGISGLWYTPGSNVLYTIKGLSIRTYTDTLAVAGSGVAVSSITPTTCAISWNDLTNAKSYLVVVNTTEKTNFYTATSSAGVTVVVNSTANTAVVTGLLPVTTYYVSVWGKTPVSSFLFDAAGTEFTTLPSVPVNLVPINGATHVSLNPSFAWGEVTGAASYEMQLGTDPTFATVLGTVTTEVPFYSWTDPLLEYDSNYFWRVRAVTDAGFSEWCTYNFHTKQEPTAAVVVEETTTLVTLTLPTAETPGYIWAIIVVGGMLTLAVIILIVRTRRVV